MDIQQKLDELLKLQSENEVLEFKSAKDSYNFEKLGKYFSALSNEANLRNSKTAWLVFGVNDEKEIIGTNFKPNNGFHKLKPQIAQQTTLNITFNEIYECYRENKRVLLFSIPSAPKGIPIAWKGHWYGRNHEELKSLNLDELERIRSQNAQDWSAEIIESATIDDLSETAIHRARELFLVKNPKFTEESTHWDNITFLNKAHLCIKGKLTNAAILLLGKPESAHSVSPANPIITWILKDQNNVDKDYEHFACPFLLATEKLYKKIRHLKYRYIKEGDLFPEEVNQYEPYLIREALNNCIAHQDYLMGGKITVVETENNQLIFENKGQFIPENIEMVLKSDAPESRYRNKLLTRAMINLNMIDTIGSGIRKMFVIQKEKYFPLPEYDLSKQRVKVTFIGKVIDVNYARKLARMPDLDLNDIFLLDRVQKKLSLTNEQSSYLRKQKLIEGRKPNYYISADLAKVTGEKADYFKRRGIDDDYCRKLITDYLEKFEEASRQDIEKVLLDKLSDVLDIKQKKAKVKNNLQYLRTHGLIVVNASNRKWMLTKSA